ncbi:DUF7336 domain-containing protein [Litchfieldia salsa]|uniref:DUF7336 domain-containing protein n=1 Tax=Litchfieldia salsa TaxID=930152 RepID=A0A1H0X0A3_9BACI|nr:hypothetical protein [Litchfieldia salsa]SDP96300.1 hypothetical protein SAMN05216565_12116 [Litchfieldia salsa]
MKYVYLLQHSYEYEYKGEIFDEIKIIGVFATKENAEKVIDKYNSLPGFKDHPLECFHIDKFEVDNISSWDEGFLKWEDAY